MSACSINVETYCEERQAVQSTFAERERRHRHHGKKGSPGGQPGSGAPPEDKVQAPAERIHFLLGEEDEGHEAHPLFSEMEVLTQSVDSGDYEWREAARWIKYEEVSGRIRVDELVLLADTLGKFCQSIDSPGNISGILREQKMGIFIGADFILYESNGSVRKSQSTRVPRCADVEEGGDRWSKPHVSTISLHSLMDLRSFLLNGTVLLDMEANSLENIAELILENMSPLRLSSSIATEVEMPPTDLSLAVNSKQLPMSALDCRDRIKEILLKRHRHQHEKRQTDAKRLPLIRSLADIGRNSSKSMFGSANNSEYRTLQGGAPLAVRVRGRDHIFTYIYGTKSRRLPRTQLRWRAAVPMSRRRRSVTRCVQPRFPPAP
ncbi:electroneutral sodium bicarbonate exchanger 1-like [Tropilaelaps mercedesae]|uniref:Electroneutral sodium bicarbonate exchanger 1-like n=1 Tax=Tropilaelaps mercedesae TaxID=418985 RepID=A0A1V9XD03_9ACAR|nr:electroneutral sodium bicarbonate exchanger 1-like [Tropilaelaps mercedesae]